MIPPIFQIASLEPLLDERPTRHVTDGFQDEVWQMLSKAPLMSASTAIFFRMFRAGKVVDFSMASWGLLPGRNP